MQNFGIMSVFKRSAMVPFQNIKGLLGTIGLTAVLYFIIFAIMALVFAGAITVEDMMSGDPAAFADLFSGVSAGAMIIGILSVWIFAVVGMTLIFNYWVRHAALGEGRGLTEWGEVFSSALTNGLKFIGVGIVIVIAAMIFGVLFGMVFAALGLVDLDAMQDPTAISGGMIGMQVLMVAGICVVYAVMSASLTRTALGSDAVEVKNARTNDFAAVLMMIYVPVIILSAVLPVMLGVVLGLILSMVLSLWSTVAIAAAHGVRHQRCVEMEAVPTE